MTIFGIKKPGMSLTLKNMWNDSNSPLRIARPKKIKVQQLCECKCRQLTKPGNKFILGHNGVLNTGEKNGMTKLTGDLNPSRRPESRRKISEKLRGRPPIKGSGRGKHGFRQDINQYVRSRWEANFARFLKLMNIGYEYEPQTFKLSNGHGYTPDFKIKNQPLFIEVKGYMSPEAQQKIDLFRAEYPQYQLATVEAKEYSKIKDAFHLFKGVGWEQNNKYSL